MGNKIGSKPAGQISGLPLKSVNFVVGLRVTGINILPCAALKKMPLKHE